MTFARLLRWLLHSHIIIRERRSHGLRLVCLACARDLGPATFDDERSELARRLDRQQAHAHKAKRRRERLAALELESDLQDTIRQESPKVRRIA